MEFTLLTAVLVLEGIYEKGEEGSASVLLTMSAKVKASVLVRYCFWRSF